MAEMHGGRDLPLGCADDDVLHDRRPDAELAAAHAPQAKTPAGVYEPVFRRPSSAVDVASPDMPMLTMSNALAPRPSSRAERMRNPGVT
jgi:hypothetical protein